MSRYVRVEIYKIKLILKTRKELIKTLGREPMPEEIDAVIKELC